MIEGVHKKDSASRGDSPHKYEFVKEFLRGVFVGLMICTAIWAFEEAVEDGDRRDWLQENGELIEECQKELPRNKFCKIIAVPEEL